MNGNYFFWCSTKSTFLLHIFFPGIDTLKKKRKKTVNKQAGVLGPSVHSDGSHGGVLTATEQVTAPSINIKSNYWGCVTKKIHRHSLGQVSWFSMWKTLYQFWDHSVHLFVTPAFQTALIAVTHSRAIYLPSDPYGSMSASTTAFLCVCILLSLTVRLIEAHCECVWIPTELRLIFFDGRKHKLLQDRMRDTEKERGERDAWGFLYVYTDTVFQGRPPKASRRVFQFMKSYIWLLRLQRRASFLLYSVCLQTQWSVWSLLDVLLHP